VPSFAALIIGIKRCALAHEQERKHGHLSTLRNALLAIIVILTFVTYSFKINSELAGAKDGYEWKSRGFKMAYEINES